MVVIYTMTMSFFVILATSFTLHGFTTTLDGPFKPQTAPLDPNLNPIAFDLPESDPNLQNSNSEFQPEQISLSLSNSFDSVWISWVTEKFQTGEEDSEPLDPNSVKSIVQYGEFNVVTRNKKVKGYSIVYNQQNPPETGLKNYTSGIIHHVQLKGLKPNTLYHYRCGDPSLSAMSKEYYFRTMPNSNSSTYPRRIVIAGDLGLTYNTSTILTHILSNHPDLVVLIGGFSYADTYLNNGTSSYQPRWDSWGRFMEPLMANVPTMMVAGEHEIESQTDNNLTFVAYSSRFAFPSSESGSFSPLYYSFNAGGAHFIVLNSYIPYDYNSSDQCIWLESDLRNINRSETPWVVASWSLPWYSTFKGHYREDETESMRINLEDLLYRNRVDIVFNSQVDAYERSNRVFNYTLDQCGPVYITIGAGGAGKLEIEHVDDPGNCPDPCQVGSRGFNFTLGPVNDEVCPVQQPDYSAYRESSFGFGMLEVKNETHALWSWNRNQDLYYHAGDIIYIVRQPEMCPVYN